MLKPSEQLHAPSPSRLWTRLHCSRCRYQSEHPGHPLPGDLERARSYVNGQAIRMNTHTTKEREARDFMASKEVDGKRGLPVLPKVNRKTVGELLDDVSSRTTATRAAIRWSTPHAASPCTCGPSSETGTPPA